MKFFSTRDHSRIVTASQAIVQGLSDEGGLFVPESFPQVRHCASWIIRSWPLPSSANI